jgi:hypothetical protein
MVVILELINGLVFGVEHIAGDEEDDFSYVIGIHFLCFRLAFYKDK